MTTLSFPTGLELEMLERNGAFLGIGAVSHRGTLLRASTLPWTVYFESETGQRFADFTLRGVERDGEAVTLVLAATGSRMPRAHETDAMGDGRIRTRHVAAATAEVRWRFRPARSTVYDAAWEGIAWTIAVSCPGNPIHWLLEEATWEIGGRAEGCTLIQRDMSTMRLEQAVTVGNAFSTKEAFAFDGWGGCTPMDMMPRGAGSSHLDYQSRGDHALALFAEKPSLTRSRIDKHAGEDVIHYIDRPFFPLGEKVEAPERTLLVHRAAKPLARHEARNLWLDLQSEIQKRILANYGMVPEVVTPTVSAHIWDAQYKELGPAWRTPLMEIFPEIARLGYDAIYTFGPWDSVTNDPVPRDGCICAPYAFTYAKEFGGAAGMRELVDAGHAAGLRISQWFANHLSRFSPVFKDHPDWLMKEPSGDPYDASYHILWTGRMRSPYGAELERQVMAVRTGTGMDGAFWDSFHNLGITAVDWGAPDKAPQAEEIFRMMGRLQAAGMYHRPECVTIFGCGQGAVFGFASDKFRRRLWSDTVENDDIFALIDTLVGFFTTGDHCGTGRLTPEQYFWMAAHRVLTTPAAHPWPGSSEPDRPRLPGGPNAEALARTNHCYRAALPHMVRPRLSEGGAYVVWHDAADKPAVVWAFRDAELPFTGGASGILDGVPAASIGGRIRLKAGQVLRLQPVSA